ncbi:hypothetical protein GCM10009104_00710 [Marinobacterium maritimum]|uniref:Uncharacterized protein n=1 Tax=Marinobacterium maritimum TaxID=500162 RepID=A0ABP3T732_9GAMM
MIHEDGVPNSKDVAQKDLVDGQFYYIAYDDIVWVELITNEQDTIINYFSSISKFEMVVTKNGIKVYG